jgi:serine/threonine protein kinase
VPNTSEPQDFAPREGDDTARRSSSTGFHVGQEIGGRYQVISRIGGGGMGLVYRVNQIFLKKEFALKTIAKSQFTESAVRRFQQEARTTFSLDHPSIISVYDFGVLGDSTPFLVMELLQGETLGDCLKRSGSLTVEQAIPVFVQICFGLAYAHEAGIVHRDIKPNNIMLLNGLPLGAEGSVKILDFGIAKLTSHEGGEIQALTRTGEVFGSPLYMSPEQCTGIKVDHRADVYSLGCVFFEALTGSPPFIGENALSTMLKHQSEQPPTLREVSMGSKFPQALEDIVATMLDKSPDRRYQNLGVLAHDLGALLRGEPAPSQSVGGGTTSKGQTNSKGKTTSKSQNNANAQTNSNPQTISLSRNSFFAMLAGAAILCMLLGFGMNGFLNRASSTDQVKNTKAPGDIEADSGLPLEQSSSEIKEKERETEAEFQRFGPIVSEHGAGKDSGMRIFIFPETPIGLVRISKIVKSKLEPKTDFPASAVQKFPETALLHLTVGGQFPASFYHPVVLTKIGEKEFDRLTIKRPDLGLIDEHEVLSDSQLIDTTIKILKIAEKWTKLKSVDLQHLPITPEVVETLNSMARLDTLVLNDPRPSNPHVLEKLSLPNLTQILICNFKNADEMIYDLQKHKRLRLIQFTTVTFSPDLKPSALEQLHAHDIMLDGVKGLTDDMLRSILRVKGLEVITVNGSVTSQQEKLLRQETKVNHVTFLRNFNEPDR